MVEHKLKILEQPWDMVVVDEAHNGAKPHQTTGRQTVKMNRWELLEQLSAKSDHLLLLTATPHNGYRDSFASLLRMLTKDFVSEDVANPVIHKDRARRSVCQRTRKQLESWYEEQEEKSPFPERDHTEIIVSPHRDLLGVMTQMESYSNSLIQKATSRKSRILTRWLVLHFQKRALSSPRALKISVDTRIDHIKEVLQKGEERKTPVDIATAQRYVTDQDTDERRTDEEIRKSVDQSLLDERREHLQRELEDLEKLKDELKSLTPAKDKKLQKLIKEVLPDLLHKDSRVIVFTYYTDTLEYLEANVKKAGLEVEILTMHGDMSQAKRREVFVEFEKARKAILISTDVIAEGLNLQHACNQVVHYELPWNPNRLEQRNGRVDRFGQPKDVARIRTLVTDQTLDVIILHALMKKAQQIREDRGYSPPFFGDEANLANLLATRAKEFRLQEISQLDLFKESRDDVTQIVREATRDPYDEATLEQIEADSFYDETDVSLPDIEARLRKTEQLLGSSDEIKDFVQSALNRFGCSMVPNRDHTFKVNLPEPRLQLPGTGKQISRVTFDPRVGLADPEVVILDLGHPLIKRLIELTRGEFFQQETRRGRTAALVKPDLENVTIVYHALVRFSVNTYPPRVIEELVTFGFEIYGDRILNDGEITRISELTSSPRPVSDLEASRHLQAAAESSLYDEAIDLAVKILRQNLVNERRELMDRIERESAVDHQWLKGIDDLTVASSDVLTAKVYLPR